MANALYDAAREAFLKSDLDIDDSIKLVCIDHTDITPNVATHDMLEDLTAGGRVATSAAFASKTTTAGVFDAADIVLSSVTGDPFESINIYNDTPGTEATKNLIAYIDTATGLPFTPSGGDITVQWDNGANKIFKL